MSDAPAPSNSPAPLTGRAAEEHKHGYKPMPANEAPPSKKAKPEFSGARDAADDLLGQRTRTGKTAKPIEEVSYKNPDGGPADDRETVTIERAADDLKAFREANGKLAEVNAADDFANQVDALRRDNAAEITGQPTEPSQPQLKQPAQSVPGLDVEVSKALAHPQIREAIEQEIGKSSQLQAQHTHHIDLANQFAQQAFLSAFPELAQYQLHEIAPVLDQMPPARRAQAMEMLKRVAQGIEAQQHFEQQRAHAQRQQFAAEARQHDAHFDRMVGHRTPEQKAAVANEMVSYAAELGVDHRTIVHLMQTNPIFRHSAFQRMMHDAITARISRREAMKYRDHIDRSAPHVQRPGHTNHRSASRGNENLSALAQKANSSGSLKDMAALLAAKRRGR